MAKKKEKLVYVAIEEDGLKDVLIFESEDELIEFCKENGTTGASVMVCAFKPTHKICLYQLVKI